MKVSIQTLSVNSKELYFFFDHAGHPVIELQNARYLSLKNLCSQLPCLLNNEHTVKFVQIANFLAKGLEFTLIEDIAKYKEDYLHSIENENFLLNCDRSGTCDYGIFDLDEIEHPRKIDNHYHFYVKHDFLKIPYRASFEYCPTNEVFEMQYELLPLLQIQTRG